MENETQEQADLNMWVCFGGKDQMQARQREALEVINQWIN